MASVWICGVQHSEVSAGLVADLDILTWIRIWTRSGFRTLGADFKNNQITKQLNNSILTNRKVEKKLYLLPIGPNRIVMV